MQKARLRRFGVTVWGLVLTGVALAQAPVPPPVAEAARAYITRAALEAPIRFLAYEFEAARKRELAAVGGN